MSGATRLLVLALGLGLAEGAWAVSKPLAVWNGDFSLDSGRNGYVVNVNGNTISDGCIILDGSGGGVIVTNDTVTTANSSNPFMIVAGIEGIKYTSNRTTQEALVSIYDSGSDRSCRDRATFVFWNGRTTLNWYAAYMSDNNGTISEWGANSRHQDSEHKWPDDQALHYFGATYVVKDSISTKGWRSYIDGTLSSYTDSTNSDANDPPRIIYGATIGGTTDSKRLMNNESTTATLKYVAIIRDTTGNTDADIAAWSLTDMTSAENITLDENEEGELTGGSDVGVNLAGGTVSVADGKTAQAVFVQEDTILDFGTDGSLAITKPLYIADGVKLKIKTDDLTIAPGSSSASLTVITIGGEHAFSDSQLELLSTSSDGAEWTFAHSSSSIVVTKTLSSMEKTSDGNYTVTLRSNVAWSSLKAGTGWDEDVTSTKTLTINNAASEKVTLTFDASVGTANIVVSGAGKTALAFSDATYANGVTYNFTGVTDTIELDPNGFSTDRLTVPNFPSSSTAILRLGGGSSATALTEMPYRASSFNCKLAIARPVNDSWCAFGGNPLNYIFEDGCIFTGPAMRMGNVADSTASQTFTQTGGTLNITNTGTPDSDTASSMGLILGHFSSPGVLYSYGGTLNAAGAVRLGWQGTASWEIGDGSSANMTATVNTAGVCAGSQSHTTTVSLSLNTGGTLTLGSYGIKFSSANNTFTFNGGTLSSSADTTIANSKSNGTVLSTSTETEIDTAHGNMTISAPLSGSGSLNVTGGGTLTITGSGAASGGTIKATDSTIVLSGNGAKPGDTMYSLKAASGSSTTAKLEIRPGEGNTITLAPTHIINSTDSGAQIIVGAGTTKIAHTQTTAGSGTFGGATVKVEDGGTLEVNNINWTVANVTYGLEIGASSKFAVNALSTNSRPITMGEGATLEISKGSSYSTTDGALKLDFKNGNGFTVNGNATIQATGEDAETPFINMTGSVAQPFNVASEKTLSVNANIKGTSALTKTGAGKLALNGYGTDSGYTYTGATTVSAGILEINATQTGSAYSLAAGSTLKFGTDASVTMPSIALPASGTAAVDVSALSITESGVTLVTFATTAPAQADVDSKLTVTEGYTLRVENNALKVYPVVAEYGGKGYETVKAAIDAAVADGHTYADVTILDATAECPDGYYIDNGTLKKKPASITVGENVYYYTTIQAAVQDALPAPYGSHSNYDYLTIYESNTAVIYESNTAVAMMDYTLKLATAPGVTGVTVSLPVSFTTTEYAVSSVSGDTYTTYSVSVNPKTYRWKNAAAGTLWTTPSNWEFQDNETWTSAQRYPGDGTTGDSVVVTDDTSIQLGNAVTLASLQVTDGALALAIPSQGTATTLTASAITLASATAAISVTDVSLSPVPTTSVADSYVKLDGSTYSVDAYNTVSFTAPNATVTRTDDLGANIKDGDTITFTVTPEAGYAVTAVAVTSGSGEVTGSGPYSYIVTGDATITVTAVSTSLTIGSGTVSYYASYTNATVTASVTGTVLEGTTFTLSGTGISGEYTGTYSAGTVTFNDVHGYKLGDTINYTIKAAGTSTGSYSEPLFTVGSVPASDNWMLWSKTQTDVGNWKDGNGTSVPPNYGDETYADFTGTNTYTAAWMSTGEVVTVTTNVKFGDVADPDMTIDADAQAAVRLFDDNGVTFQVWNGDDWVNVSNGTLGTPSGDETYQVEVKLNYSTQKYGVKIGEYQLALTGSNPAVTLFPLAKAASAMQQVSYLGAGSFISLSGEYVSAGYTADVGTEGSATNVVVSSDFVNRYMSDKLASEISDLLDPNATKETKPNAIAANGYNYFTSYALGLDPTEKDDKVIVDVTTDNSGNFVFTVKHPVFDVGGNITGYEPVTEAANVTTTVTLKYGTSTEVSGGTSEVTEIAPSSMDFGADNVLYYKAEVTIGAK